MHICIEFKPRATVHNLFCAQKPLSNLTNLTHSHNIVYHGMSGVLLFLAVLVLSNEPMRSQHSKVQGAMEDFFVVPTLVALQLWERIQFVSFLHLI